MSARLVGWIALTLALAAVLSLFAPWLMLLAVPIAAAAMILVARYGRRRRERDLADLLVSGAAALPGHAQVDWGAALRAELASIVVPRERRRFAVGAAVALIGTPRRLRSGLLAAGLAAVFAVGLLAFSRAAGEDGLGSVTVLLPPVLLFAVGFVCARRTGSLRFGVETGFLAASALLVATAVVLGVEAARWFDVAHVSVLDGELVDAASSRAAVLDALHPVILLAHLLFWLPWPALGAVAGARTRRQVTS